MAKEILIILNRGGWGDGGLERARKEKGVLEGISQILSSQGFKCKLQVFDRLPSPTPIKYLKAFFDFLGAYKQASLNLEKEMRAILATSPGVGILLVGYSLGAIVNISVMKQFLQDLRVYSIDIGAPLFAGSLSHPRVLNLQRKNDVFASGPLLPFLFVLLQACLVVAANIGAFQGRSILDVWHIKGHDYAWEDPAVRVPIEQFLHSNFPQIVLR